MHKRQIKVRCGFAKDVHFEMDFWKQDKSEMIREVLKAWTDVTGLSFDKMPCEDHSGDLVTGNEGYIVLVVEHPLTNRSKVQFVWDR